MLLLILLVLSMVPVLNMINISLQGRGPVLERFLSNYTAGWNEIKYYIANSVVTSLAAMVGVLFLSSLSGYVFARHKFPGKEFLFLAIISLLMIPGIFTLIPSFMIIVNLKLIDSRLALILPWMASGQVFGVLICRGYFQGLPEELFEAARIDGANEFILYLRIALPLALPILATLAIMNLLNTYNDFLWPLIVIRSSAKQVVSVGLRYVGNEWQSRMAAYMVSTVPLLLLFAFGSRYYMRGITSGAIKI
ncbi:MAG: carbohydrate ABC transporter permease [Anaerolineae bacterium]